MMISLQSGCIYINYFFFHSARGRPRVMVRNRKSRPAEVTSACILNSQRSNNVRF